MRRGWVSAGFFAWIALAISLATPAESDASRGGLRPAKPARAARRPARAKPVAPSSRTVELDWIHHLQEEVGQRKTIVDRRVGDEIHRRVITDAPVDTSRPSRGRIPGGRFQRTIAEQRIKVARGLRPWSDSDAPHLYSRARQGVEVDTIRDKVTVRFWQPTAERVELVIEGEKKPRVLKPTASGMWEANLGTAPRRLYGKEYHFRVTRKGGATERLADPMADYTERSGERIISRFADLEFKWRDQGFKTPPLHDLVIYEAHLPSLSRHPSSGVAPEFRGTYRGAMASKIVQYVKQLGVAIQYMPLHAADGLLGGDWGYWSTSYRAFNERYARPQDRMRTNKDLMALVDAHHRAGTPVIFDVVYNHGGELVVRALGEEIMYRPRDANGNYPEGWPTVRSEHPMVREMIVQTLQNLVKTYHADGFRFDLGSLHDKHTMRAIARRLPRRIHLFSEPWAFGPTKWNKGDLLSTFADTRWAVWNDDFRVPVTTLIKGDATTFENRDRVKQAIAGSHPWLVRPNQAVNYWSSHDGLYAPAASADIVGGDRGRAFLGLVLTLFSQGVPMIAEGTEFMRSKDYAENTFNDPSKNQIDWDLEVRNRDMATATAKLIGLRKRLPHFKYKTKLREGKDITFIYANGYPNADKVNALGFVLRPPAGQKAPAGYGEVLVLTNGGGDGATFQVPAGKWKVIADGVRMEVDEGGIAGRDVSGDYYLQPGSTAVLARDP